MNIDVVFHGRRALIWPALLSFCLLFVLRADANPTGGTVSQGSATFSSSGSTFNINQSSANAFINWQSFNIGLGETVNFNQPSASSVTFNQINQGNASQILGDMNANGYVVLENANGFYIGGQASITAHGLVLTTATTPALNLGAGGPWSFDAPPPAAKIQNFGQIKITGGGTAYLIAADIVNGGSINAPNGQIGLYDGETVLVSSSPNGEGISAEVTLPQGSVDNEGRLTADGGSVVAQAQFVNQNGIVQANSAENVNGTIELLGGSSVALGAKSVISAQGDAQGVSSGGSVNIQAGNTFSDQAGSTIDVAGGAQGGNGGRVNICAPHMGAINSIIDGRAQNGFTGGILSIDPNDIWLDTADNAPQGSDYTFIDINNYSGMSQINIQADNNIVLNTIWNLTVPATLSLTAGNDITLNSGSAINAALSEIPTDISLQAGNEIMLASSSGIQANGGNIALTAATVDLAGTLQANSVGSANGLINVNAAQSLRLEASSIILANGDPNATTTPSPGGFVVLNAGNNYSDALGSTISVSGTGGGKGGIVEIFDPQAGSTAIQTTVSGAFAYLVNPYDMTLSGNPTVTSSVDLSDPNFNVLDLAAYSQIDLQALDDIQISTLWSLNNPVAVGTLSLTAGNSISLGTPTASEVEGINAGQNWSVNLTAGTGFVPTAAQPTPASGTYGIYLYSLNPYGTADAYIETQNGNINLWAANEVQVGWLDASAGAGNVNGGQGYITTAGGGNINVTTQYGDVNTGSDQNGYSAYNYFAPYDTVAKGPGGISTAAGGNVSIAAGGDVITYLPLGSSASQTDAGTGAFGTQAGNVSVSAGGSVYGHYIVINGTGTIYADQNIGSSVENIALSLASGGWNVIAPNGNIYLQEVRNPNGLFNNSSKPKRSSGTGISGTYLFTYSPDAYVDLAANAVYLTGENVPRLNNAAVPVLYPPILDILAGSGGVTLENNVTLFPSVDQNLDVTTADGGNFSATGGFENPYQLYMSDSSEVRWNNSASFTDAETDHGSLANEPDESSPVYINISGNMEDLDLLTSKETQIIVGGDMINCSFSGQNLQASDVTSIYVAGQIYSTSPYSFTILNQGIPNIPIQDLLLGMGNSWDNIFTLAVNTAELNNPTVLQNLTTTLATTSASSWADEVLQSVGMFTEETIGNQLVGLNPGFVYNPTTGRLGFTGPMGSDILSELSQPTITILHLVNGQPVPIYAYNPQTQQNQIVGFKTDTITWAPASAVQTLYTESQGTPTLSATQTGYEIGGPGQFDITAGSISLGNSDGIISSGIFDTTGGGRFANLAPITPVGATINILVTGPDQPTDPGQPVSADNPLVSSLDMLTSTIASLDGGSINVMDIGGSMDLGSPELTSSTGGTSANNLAGSHLAFGIYSTGGGNVSVTALGDVDIDGSRIASYDGGNILVESLTGDVNIGSGTPDLNTIDSVYTGEAVDSPYEEDVFGSGVVAYTLEPPYNGVPYPPAPSKIPGNIIIETLRGDIISGVAGILQEALDGTLPSGPSITLAAGTFPSGKPGSTGYSPGYVGNIDSPESDIIGGDVSISANGSVNVGKIVSRGNLSAHAAGNFNATVVSTGQANVAAGGTVSGTIAGLGGVNVSGQGVSASLLGQNVSVNGGASQSTLGSSATATASTQSAAQQASSQSQQQVTADTSNQDDKKKKNTQIRKVGHVTVILASAR